ncbi:MAG: helix-turn-helix domain-containing protein, partial [Hyphomonadaceae bacterium]|nr:helix-turn-helix domain-containing protein [Hyphomonadaceae bacterium]
SWRGDMVEERRKLRGPLLAALAVYMLVLSGFEIAEALGWDSPWHRLAGAASLALFSIVGAAAFLAPRETLFGTPVPAATQEVDPGVDPQDRAIAQRLDALMGGEEIWRREGLTIGALADALAAPEHRVRRVINTVLGHRNFAAFVNARRIAAARAALADPANAGKTVAAIAFDLGFGSLGPFNRAFKDATGLTPTEFRQKSLAETPKP